MKLYALLPRAASKKITMATTLRSQVLSGYRRLFRARKILFHGDDHAMTESRWAIRVEFEKNRQQLQPATQTTLQPFLTMIDEAEDMLLHGFARGTLNPDSGNYEIKLKPEHSGDDDIVRNIVEPVTRETGDQLGSVVVTSSSSCHNQQRSS